MVEISVRASEACRPQPHLLWDTVWIQEPVTLLTAEGGFGDWQVGNYDEPGNYGGLQAKAALATATLLQLMTDGRAPDDVELPGGDDRRGWWGDSVLLESDPFDRPMGNRMWVYIERGVLNDQVVLEVQEAIEEAMAIFAEQGAVAHTEVEVESFIADGRLHIGVRHFAQDGAAVYDQRFGVLWAQGIVYPLAQTLTR